VVELCVGGARQRKHAQHCKLGFDPNLRVFMLAKPLMAGLTTWGFIPDRLVREDGMDIYNR